MIRNLPRELMDGGAVGTQNHIRAHSLSSALLDNLELPSLFNAQYTSAVGNKNSCDSLNAQKVTVGV